MSDEAEDDIRRSHLYRRLKVTLAETSHDDLVAMVARQQLRAQNREEELRQEEQRERESPGRTEIELQQRLALVYYGTDRGTGFTIDEILTEMERDSMRLGYPFKEYVRRFDSSRARR